MRAAIILSSSEEVIEYIEGIAFKRTEPGKITGSWGIMLRRERRIERGNVVAERESMVIEPSRRSRRRKRASRRDDLPLMYAVQNTDTLNAGF